MDLPDDLPLPLASGEGWWYWLGGRPSFDFVNTLRERWWRNVETLVTPDDLGAWLDEAGLLEAPAVASEPQLRSARRLRAAIDAGIVAAIEGRPPAPRAIEALNLHLRRAAPVTQLALDGATLRMGPRPPDDPVDQALHQIARDAAAVLGTDQRARARVCASETCSARFFDASHAGTRRWCSMRACGNTAKARRHRARSAGAR